MSKNKLIVLSGLPGCGKSVWAKELCNKDTSYVRVNRDDLRNMRGKYWIPTQEDMITEWERNCVKDAISFGYNVIVDATNFRGQEYWKNLAKKWNYEYELKFFDVPLEECIKRDNERTVGKVGESVIRGMHSKYIANRVEFLPVVQNVALPKCVLIDLDGTLAIHNGRGPFELHKVKTDIVNAPVANVVKLFYDKGYSIIYMSGREDKCEGLTREWLDENGLPPGWLYMRKTGDNRKDDIVKYELFNKHVKDVYYVEFCIDDRDSIVALWRKLGLICFQCNYGDF